MKLNSTPQNSLHIVAAMLAIFSASETALLAVNIAGDTVTTDLTVNGNTTASGWGLFKQGVDVGVNGETMLNWFPGTAPVGTATFDIIWADGTFTWRDTVVGLTSNTKMSLDAANSLTLYKANGAAVGLTLNPNSGITLSDGTQLNNAASLRSTALYDASGNLAASVAADGKVKFTNGITFGSDPNVKLNASNVAALQSTLKNLGYQENPVIGTAIKKIALNNAQITAAVAMASNLYVVGNFNNTATVGGWGINSAGGGDGFVAKLNAAGAAVWVKSIGGISSDTANSVSVDSSGNVWVGGNFNGAMSNLGVANNILSAGMQDGYVVKLNASGVVQWTKSIGGTGYDTTTSVSVDGTGIVIVAGSFQGATTNLPGADMIVAGSNDGYVAKFSPIGGVVWAKSIGGISNDFATSVSVDATGNVLVGGNFSGTTTSLVGANLTSAGSDDGYVAKFNTSGVVQWAKAIGGVSQDTASSVCLDSSGSVLMTGNFQGVTTNLGTANLTSAGSNDGYVTKLNTAGVVQWAKQIGGTSYDTASTVSIDAIGNVLVGGSFSGTTTTLASANLTSVGGNDGYIARFAAANGNPLDALAVGGSGYDFISGMAFWGSEIYVWGSAGSTFAMGSTRVAKGSFLAGWPALNVITPVVPPAAPLAWSGSAALGSGSTALGSNAFADGANSTALGNGNSLGSSSFSAGNGNASGADSVALGNGTAIGLNSVALGNGTAVGQSSVALGNGTASGSNAFAFGVNGIFGSGTASGIGSVIFGNGTASGFQSTIFGAGSYATGNYATSFGSSNTSSGHYATAFGSSLTAQAMHSFVLGRNNIIQGDPVNWLPTDDLFVIGNGASAAARSNALSTLKNGQTTLTNQEWKTNPDVVPSAANSNAEALVVEGHTVLKGTTTLNGKVIIAIPQGDISMGIYQ